MIENGIYVMSDYDNQETLVKVIEKEKSISFELVGDKPYFTKGDMDMFLYDKGKRTIKKIKSGHSINIVNDKKFVLYPYQSGNPYLFTFEGEF